MVEVISNNDVFIFVRINPKCFIIYDSHRIRDDELKKWFIRQILQKYPYIKEQRSFNSIFNEWKVHNAFYNKKMFLKQTKNTDFELNQNIFLRLAYALISKLLRE